MKNTTTTHSMNSVRSILFCLLTFAMILPFLTPIAFATDAYQVEIRYNGQVVDTFNGVQAIYNTGTNNTNTGDLSCAGLVKRYYQTIFDVTVYNLTTRNTPKTDTQGCTFQPVSISNAKSGDIVYMENNKGQGHWALAKEIHGNTVTVFEQNWKWSNGGTTYCTVNRVVSPKSIFRLYRNGVDANNGSNNSSNTVSFANASEVDKLMFDARIYFALYDDLQQAIGYNPDKLYEHWVKYGRSEGRIASVFFDPKFYGNFYQDLQQVYGNNYAGLYEHWITYGIQEGRQGSAVFNLSTYLEAPDLKAAYEYNHLGAFSHFLVYGASEHRVSSPTYSVGAYLQKNPDVAQAFSDPVSAMGHYIRYCLYGTEVRECK